MTELEKCFEQELKENDRECIEYCGYTPTRWIQMFQMYGGVKAARRLIYNYDGNLYSRGLKTLYEKKRLDLSVEATVLKSKYRDLFTDDERNRCLKTLKAYGYEV